MFRLFKIQKWCQKWTFHATFSRKSGITWVPMSICFKVMFSIWLPVAILKFDVQTDHNRKLMPHLVGKGVLHWSLCPFIFNFHFQYDCRQPYLILASPKFRRHFARVMGAHLFLWWNDAHSLMMLRRGALLFFKVIRQISRSHSSKNRRIWPRLGVSGL